MVTVCTICFHRSHSVTLCRWKSRKRNLHWRTDWRHEVHSTTGWQRR